MPATPPDDGATDRRPRLFHALIKPAGGRCNLACDYCFYLDRTELYPDSALRMSEATLDAVLGGLFHAFRDAPVVPVAWQGGEPTLMGLEFFRLAATKIAALRRPGQRVEQSLQTNGVLLDEAWCDHLAEHQVLVGLSIDGPEQMHDRYRRDRGGRGTHDRVVRAAQLLRERGVEANAMVTVHAANADHPVEVYRYLRDQLGFAFVQLVPIVERTDPGGLARGGLAAFPVDEAPVTDRTVRPEAWGDFLCGVFDEWVRHDVGRVFLPMFEAALACWLGLDPAPCVSRQTCGDAVIVEHNGDLYACDHFVTPVHLRGNVAEQDLAGLVRGPEQVAFGEAKREALPDACQRCPVEFACRGECPRNRFLATEDGEPGLNWLCAGQRAFFEHIDGPMRTMADLVAAVRPASGVMELLRLVDSGELERLSPHAPCPCGSGRKLKRCHRRR